MQSKESKSLQGKKSRQQGNIFEKRVRVDLEEKGWIVDKWSNNVINGKLVQARAKFNPFTKRVMNMSSGFPDFIAYQFENTRDYPIGYIIGVESKMTGKLDKEEKDKCKWLLENNIFSKILIAKKVKVKNKIIVEYNEFK